MIKYRGVIINLNHPQKGRLILIHALCHFCNDYHSGQWSRGYRILCRSLDWLKTHGLDRPIDIPLRPIGQRIYQQLVNKYQGNI